MASGSNDLSARSAAMKNRMNNRFAVDNQHQRAMLIGARGGASGADRLC